MGAWPKARWASLTANDVAFGVLGWQMENMYVSCVPMLKAVRRRRSKGGRSPCPAAASCASAIMQLTGLPGTTGDQTQLGFLSGWGVPAPPISPLVGEFHYPLPTAHCPLPTAWCQCLCVGARLCRVLEHTRANARPAAAGRARHLHVSAKIPQRQTHHAARNITLRHAVCLPLQHLRCQQAQDPGREYRLPQNLRTASTSCSCVPLAGAKNNTKVAGG